MAPAPTAAAAVVAGRRRAPSDGQVSTSFITVSSVDIAIATVHPTNTELPLDSSGVDSGAAATQSYLSATFQGVGGVPTADALTITSAVTFETPASTSASRLSEGSSTKPIPISTVVAVFATVPVVCALLITLLWWKRRADRVNLIHTKHMRTTSFGGSQGFNKMIDSDWDPASSRLPGSPALLTAGKANLGESVEKLSLTTVTSAPTIKANPPVARRYSAKSTFTAKINPSNNFATSHDESHDDNSFEDGRSVRSHPPLSPNSTRVVFGVLPSSFPRLGTAAGDVNGEPESFLIFRSGNADMKNSPPVVGFSSDTALRAGPTAQNTPLPKRASTHRSHKGGQPTLSEGSQDKPPIPPIQRPNPATIANLIAALDQASSGDDEVHSNSAPSLYTANPFQD